MKIEEDRLPENPPKLISKTREWVEYHLEKNLEHLKAGWVAVAIIAIGAFWMGYCVEGSLDEKALKGKDATIEQLRTGTSERNDTIARLKEDLGKSRNSYPQVLNFSKDPNAESLIPDATNRPALAYGLNASFSVYLWDTNSQSWQCIMR